MSTVTKKPNTSHWTIAKYVAEVYIPDREAKVGMTKNTGEWYQGLAHRLREWLGRDPKLRELTPERLEEFERWCVSTGCKKQTARARVQAARSVLRHWRPDAEEWAKSKPNARPQPGVFLEADVKGSLEQIFQDHYLPENTRLGSEKTIKLYGHSIRLFSEFLGHTATLADLTDENVGRYLRTRVRVDGVKEVTANGEAKKIKAMWNWAANKRLVEYGPNIDNLPEPEVTPRAWTKAELATLYAACKRQRGSMSVVGAAAYWTAFHLVQWDTGERTGAMLQLTWAMLDPKEGHLTVPAEVRKGRGKAMVYRLKPPTLQRLEMIRLPERELIFGQLHKATFYYRYKRLVGSAGLPWIPWKSGPQKMRRSFASHIIAAGGDATAALRHSSRRVTEDSYTDPAIARPTPANALLFDLDASVEGGKSDV